MSKGGTIRREITLREHDWLVSSAASPSTRARLDGQRREVVEIDHDVFEALRAFDEEHARRDAFPGGDNKLKTILDWNDTSAKASQWVGVLECGGVRLEILPKVDALVEESARDDDARNVLMGMIAYGEDLSSRSRGAAHMSLDRAPLSEVFIHAFAQELLEELRKGVERGYVAHREVLSTMRGRMLATRQVMLERWRSFPHWCEYDEFEANTPLNQILLSSCHILMRRTTRLETQRALRDCTRRLDGVDKIMLSSKHFECLTFTRQTKRFERSIAFCKLLLDDLDPAVQSGRSASYAMCFDMNRVYEKFVEGFIYRELGEWLEEERISFEPQGGQKSFLLRSQATKRGQLAMRPDFLFRARDARCFIMDTKWKVLEEGKQAVSREDLYQLHAYLTHYGAHRVALLYPYSPQAEKHSGYTLSQDINRLIDVKTLVVSHDPRREPSDIAEQLKALIKEGLDL